MSFSVAFCFLLAPSSLTCWGEIHGQSSCTSSVCPVREIAGSVNPEGDLPLPPPPELLNCHASYCHLEEVASCLRGQLYAMNHHLTESSPDGQQRNEVMMCDHRINQDFMTGDL